MTTLPAGNVTERNAFWRFPREQMFVLGAAVALIGGMAHQLDAEQIATLLTTFGLGGLLFQYAAGWLADHRGMLFTCLCCCAGTATNWLGGNGLMWTLALLAVLISVYLGRMARRIMAPC